MTITVDLQVVTTPEVAHPTQYDFEAWIQAVADYLSDDQDREICIRLVDEAEITRLNATYRKKNQPTNILAFSYDDDSPLLGDLAICATCIDQEATEKNIPAQSRWAHIVIHGTLHLFGHTHAETSTAITMEAAESAILNNLGYPNPYEETVS